MKYHQRAIAVFLMFFSAIHLNWADESLRSRTSFNNGWRFARFGPMPDGSERSEPGETNTLFRFSASSEAPEQNGFVRFIADQNLSTCWNAAGRDQQWVAIDFMEPQEIAGIWIKWGFAGAPGITISSRNDQGD
jgi:hypothetical protein